MQSAESKFITAKIASSELERRERLRTLAQLRVLSITSGICLVIIALTLGALLTKGLIVSIQNEQSLLSNNRAKYESALAKWNNLQIVEYEQTLRDMSDCRYKMVVQVDRSTGRAVEKVTNVESLGSAGHDNPYCIDGSVGQHLTVQQLFSL